MIEKVICMSIVSHNSRLPSKCAPLNVSTSVGKQVIAVNEVSDNDTLESVGLHFYKSSKNVSKKESRSVKKSKREEGMWERNVDYKQVIAVDIRKWT